MLIPASVSVSKPVPAASVPPLPVVAGKASAPKNSKSNEGSPALNLAPAVAAPAVKLTAPKTASMPSPFAIPKSVGPNESDYVNGDGSITREISPTPMNVQNSDGSWTPAQSAVSANATTGGFAAANNPLHPSFAAKAGTGKDFTVNSGTHAVTMSLVGAAAVPAARPSTKGVQSREKGLTADAAATAATSTVTYSSVKPGEDLDYQVSASQVKETLVLDAAPAAGEQSWTWRVHAPGLTMSRSVFSSFDLTDAAGVVE